MDKKNNSDKLKIVTEMLKILEKVDKSYKDSKYGVNKEHQNDDK